MKHSFARTKSLIIEIVKDVDRKRLPLVAAGLAYYFLLSLFPALALLGVAIAYLPLESGSQEVTAFLAQVMPSQKVAMLEELLRGIGEHHTGLLSFGILVTLWLASSGTNGVIAGLDIAYGVAAPRPFWKNSILAVGLTFCVGMLLLVGIALTLVGASPGLQNFTAGIVGSWWFSLWPYLRWLLAPLSTFAAVLLLFREAPSAPPSRRLIMPGAIASSAGWIVLSWALGIYFDRFGAIKLDRFYGSFATPVAVMVWLYWGAQALLMGAELNALLLKYRNRHAPESGRFAALQTR